MDKMKDFVQVYKFLYCRNNSIFSLWYFKYENCTF